MSLNATKKQFVQTFYKKVKEICPAYGLYCFEAITAQACCESAYGVSKLSYKYHNYFGMKCGSTYKGPSVNLSTNEEYTTGTYTQIKANFRTYTSMEEGIKGYCEFIAGYKRYSNLINCKDNATYISRIKADGWATSSTYVATLTSISNTIRPYLGEASTVSYYPKYTGASGSIVNALSSFGIDSSFTHRAQIAKANGITNYTGTAAQNITLLSLLKKGTLVKEG